MELFLQCLNSDILSAREQKESSASRNMPAFLLEFRDTPKSRKSTAASPTILVCFADPQGLYKWPFMMGHGIVFHWN